MAINISALRLFTPKFPFFSPTKPVTSNPTLFLPKHPSIISASITFQRLKEPRPAPAAGDLCGGIDVASLPPRLIEIVSLFQSVTDSKAKYLQLLHYASKLPSMADEFKNDDNRVAGCVSRVWVRAFPDPAEPGAVRFEADSDALITRGLAALLVIGLSGLPPRDIFQVPPDFVMLLGIQQSLTASRNNGFLNMFQLMKKKALEFESQSSISYSDPKFGGRNSGYDKNLVVGDVTEEKVLVLDEKIYGNELKTPYFPISRETVNVSENEVITAKGSKHLEDRSMDLDENHQRSNDADVGKNDGTNNEQEPSLGRADRIRMRLERELVPQELVVEDISYQHAGHAALRGIRDSETHFNVRVVSKEFEGKSMVKRHRFIYNLLQEELESGLHAISIDAKTPDEVQ